MKNILVLSDFSDCASNAMKFAISIAESLDAQIYFYHSTYRYILSTIPEKQANQLIDNDLQEKMQMLKEQVAKVYIDLNKTFNKDKAKHLVEFGSVVTDHLNDTIHEFNIDMIIMGTKGASGLSRLMFGSNTVKVIDSVSCPVLSIPDNFNITKLNKIGLASDLNHIDDEISMIAPMAKALNAPIEIFHLTSPLENENSIDEKAILTRLKTSNAFDKIELYVKPREAAESIVDDIEKVIEERKPSIIVMFSLRYNWLEKILLKSYTKDLVYQSNIPVLTFKEHI